MRGEEKKAKREAKVEKEGEMKDVLWDPQL